MNKSLGLLLITASFLTHNSNAAPDQDKRTKVTVQSVDSLSFFPIRTAPAKVLSLNNSKIPARVTGILERINFRVGDQVRHGSILAQLDCQTNELMLEQLTAEIKRATITHEFQLRELARAKKLQQDHSLSESEFDRIHTETASGGAQLKGLQANLKRQQLDVSFCNVTAPYDGVVIARPVSIGEQVNVGQVVAVLLQSNNVEVSAQVPLGDSDTFNSKNRYWFEINQQQYPLKLRQLLSVVENNSRSREARLEFIEQNAMSGATGRVKWQSPSPYLPAYLLQQRDGHYGYFVAVDNRAKFIQVVDASEGRPIALQGDEQYQVIIDGRLSLTDQIEVIITETDNKTVSQ